MTRKPAGPLRRGWTTGACATAATKAAYTALLTGEFPDPVRITLPKGQTPEFALAREELGAGRASATIVKDAGDDPDVTHGAMIVSSVRNGPSGCGVVFEAGSGVGTAAVQLARRQGARVVGTSRTPDKLARCRDLGLEVGVVGDEAWWRGVAARLRLASG